MARLMLDRFQRDNVVMGGGLGVCGAAPGRLAVGFAERILGNAGSTMANFQSRPFTPVYGCGKNSAGVSKSLMVYPAYPERLRFPHVVQR